MIVLFSDIHFHNWTQFSKVLPSGRNSRLQDTVDVVKQIEDYCAANSIKHAVLLGDLFHSRTKIDIDVYDAAWKSMQSLAGVLDKLFILMGNHDAHNRSAGVHSLEPFKEFAEVIDEPCRIVIGDYEAEAIPWTAEREDFVAAMKQAKPADLLFLHQAVIGGELSSGYKKAGDIAKEDILYENYDRVFMGDFHKPQHLQPNLHYVGSPLQQNFGEAGECKRFCVYGEGQVLSVPTSAPRFFGFDTPAEFRANTEVNPDYDFVRVCYDGETLDDMAAIAEQHPKIAATPKTQTLETRQRADSKVVDSDFALLQHYVATAMPEETDEYRRELVVLGMEILNAE